MSNPLTPIRAFLPALVLLAGCAEPGRPATQEAATRQACQQQADRVFLRQHRELMSERDTRDTPFADHEVTGITSAGLGERYGRDQMVADCLANSAGSRVPGAANTPTTDGNASPAMSPDAPLAAPPGQMP